MTAPRAAVIASSMLAVRQRFSDPEVLLARRNGNSRNFADFWVFPGGKVDATDQDLAISVAQCPGAAPVNGLRHTTDPALLLACGVAAWRELIEETVGPSSVASDPNIIAAAIGNAIYWSHWLAPKIAAVQFDTRFFLIDAALLPHEPRADGTEIAELRWLTPANAIEHWRRGEFSMAPPTVFNLLELQQSLESHGNLAAVLAAERDRDILTIRPRINREIKPMASVFPWDADYVGMDATEMVLAQIPDRYRNLVSRLPVSGQPFHR